MAPYERSGNMLLKTKTTIQWRKELSIYLDQFNYDELNILKEHNLRRLRLMDVYGTDTNLETRTELMETIITIDKKIGR